MNCRLNGISPTELDSRMLVTDIIEQPPEYRRIVCSPALGHGSLLTEEKRLCLRVTVKLILRERRTLQRCQLLRLLSEWAGAGSLEVDYRPDSCLMVRCEELPRWQGRDWTEEVRLVFAARQVPWWQERLPRSLTLTDRGEGFVPGRGLSPVSWQVTNTGETDITEVTLTCGDTSQRLEGLLSPGQSFTGNGETGVLSLTGGARLTEDSDDLLLARCGQPWVVTLQTDGTAQARVWTRGRFL